MRRPMVPGILLRVSIVALALVAPAARALPGSGPQTPVTQSVTRSYRPRPVLGIAVSPVPQATAEGEPIGDPVTATIGPDGGTLSSGDGLCEVTVPAGALPAPMALTLQPIANLAWGGVGTAYRLGPAGTTFDVPVTIAFDLGDDDSAPVSLEALGIAEQDGDGYWTWIRGVERTEESASAEVRTGGSAGGESPDETLAGPKRRVSGTSSKTGGKAVVGSVRMDPERKLVQLGEQVPLQISACYPEEDPNLASLTGGPCKPVGNIATDGWSVGPAGSNRGTVSGARARGTYRAPFTRPNPAIALVSVHVSSWRGLPSVILRSRFSIDPPDLTGTFNITEKFGVAPGPQVTLKFEGHADLLFRNEHEGPPPYESLPYTMDGWLTLKTQSYTFAGSTCTNTSAATQLIAPDAQSYFNVWHDLEHGTNMVHWVLEPQHWLFTCTPTGQTVVVTVSFGLLSGSSGCTTPEWVEFPIENFPTGKFSETCNIGVTYDADWKFEPQ